MHAPEKSRATTRAATSATPDSRSAIGRVDNVRMAVYSVILTVLALSFGDAIVKLISADISMWQLYVLRSSLAVPALIVLLKLPALGSGVFMPIAMGWSLLRSLLMVGVWVFYYAALPHVAFSVAASVLYTIPLFITLFSALFTGERVSLIAWLAVGFGFGGVLLIVRPTAEDFNLHALWPLLAALLFACAMIITRTKCRREDPKVLALMQNLMFILIGGAASGALLVWQPLELAASNPFLFAPWAPITAAQWLAMVLIAATVVIGNICGAFAYQRGPSALIATFDYAYLVFSLLWGFLLFSEIPDLQSLIGMVIIAAAGIIVARQHARPA